jgi:cardiolipin-specific phospholipase
LAVAKAAVVASSTWGGLLITTVIILSATVICSAFSLWIPGSYSRLCQTEKQLLDSQIKERGLKLSVVAGLGTIEIPCQNEERADNASALVLIHGFASANVFWMLNLEALSEHHHVYAVEWPGVGRSLRASFPAKDRDVRAAEGYFVSKLEEWRAGVGLTTFALCGHSMGACIAVSYMEQHPQYVRHLVLVSPAAVPSPPPEVAEQHGTGKWNGIFPYLWHRHTTPMAVIRFMGPFGKRLLRAAVTRRLGAYPESSPLNNGGVEKESVVDYLYDSWVLRPSSDRAMATMLYPGPAAREGMGGDLWGRRPIGERLTSATSCIRTMGIPLSVFYGGGFDWMDAKAGKRVVDSLVQAGADATWALIPKAGHQVFLDNPHAFNRAMISALSRATSATSTPHSARPLALTTESRPSELQE